MIPIYLGLTFSGPLLPAPPPEAIGERYVDYAGLLRYLELFYALGTSGINRDPLRVEQYRQVVETHLAQAAPVPFYAAAFAADKLATAEELLGRRDELLEAGYRLGREAEAGTPARIAVLHELEEIILAADNERELLPGPPDRLNRLLAVLLTHRHPKLHVYVHEPRQLLPVGLQRLLARLEEAGDRVTPLPEPALNDQGTDLNRWQEKLQQLLRPSSNTPPNGKLRGDGSLVILRAQRETHLAAYLARMVRDNPDWRPGVLMTVRNQTLDNALKMEGLPSMGIPSTSLARPSLQVLKLVTAFLWDPVEVERVMEFVSLVTKPFDRRLGQKLAIHLADTPGLFGARWVYTVEETFRQMQERGYPAGRIRRAREQYDFWFRRRRHPRDGRVPKAEVRALFVFLRNWALEAFDEDKEQSGLLVLSAQAERATELLDAQPETELSYLEVERLVRTIYQPAPTQFSPAEQGGLRASFAPASAARLLPVTGQEPLDRLIWWDFVETDTNYFFSRYYPPELAYLTARGCKLQLPEQRNELLIWQNLRPILHTQDQLVLCLPQRVDGTVMEPHALMGDLEAAFGDSLDQITVNIDEAGQPDRLLQDMQLPSFVDVPLQPLERPVPHLTLVDSKRLQPREPETPTAIDDLLYYPHKWVFRHQLQLRGTPILSIANENRLRGNLSHLFIEQLLDTVKEADHPFTREEVVGWIDENATRLLRQQGAVLLEYGQEPERVQFLLAMKKSAWMLLSFIQQNGWSVAGTEQEITGTLLRSGDQPVTGRADLVLTRTTPGGMTESAVVDLKWRGKGVFSSMIRNGQDIQLALYAEFLRQMGQERVHTAYYLLRDGKMLSRNELAFAGAEVVPVPDDYTVVQREMLGKIQQTYDWRWQQFAEGLIEVRCGETAGELDDLYVDLPHDRLLEMKDDTSPFDDYRALIGLIR